jgi:hypothetical protein
MNQSRCYALFFFLALTKIAVSSPLPAQESLRSRFLAEGPKGWKTLDRTVRQMEGKWVGHYKLGVHPMVIQEAKFKINGNLLVYEETRKIQDEKINRVIALGANSKYQFGLQQHRPPSSWAMVYTGAPTDPMDFDHPYSRATGTGFVRFLHAPFTVNCMPIAEMIGESGFKLENIEEVPRDGKKLAKIEFRYTPPKITQELVKGKPIRRNFHMTKMRGGWMLLDPEQNWSLQECSLDLEGGEKNTRIVKYAVSDGGLHLPSSVFEKDNSKSVWEVTFSNLRIRDIREEEFTLTVYGFPEPVGVVWPKPTRWYVWLALAAFASLSAAVLFQVVKRRFQGAAPVKS